MGLQDAAMSYCNMRLLIGGSITIIIGVILSICGIYITTSPELDTSDYKETTANVKSAIVVAEEKTTGEKNHKVVRVVYKLDLQLEYTVNGKVYQAKSIHNEEYITKDMAQAAIPNVTSKVLYYDPKNPAKHNEDKSAEDKVAFFLSVGAVVMIICGIISIVLRKNPIFCGMTIAKDTLNVFDRD